MPVNIGGKADQLRLGQQETVFRSLDIDAQVPSRQLVSGDRELFRFEASAASRRIVMTREHHAT